MNVLRPLLAVGAALALVLPAGAQAAGYFTPANLTLDALAAGAEHVVTGDFDGDGRADLVASSGTKLVVRLNASARGDTDATFAAGPTFTTSNPITDLTAADLNHDGRDDLIAAMGAAANPASFFSSAGVLDVQGSAGLIGAFELEAADLAGADDPDRRHARREGSGSAVG